MLILRNEQIEATRSPARQKFYADLVLYIKNNFPKETEEKSEKDLLKLVEDTVNKAQTYDIKAERDLYTFVNIVMVYGFDFDDRKETIWTVAYLTDKKITSPSIRINRLYQEIVYRLKVEENNARIQQQFYEKKIDKNKFDFTKMISKLKSK